MKNRKRNDASKIDPLTGRAEDYARIFGHCSICEAPIWFTRLIDGTGTPLLAYHCWNGHYETLDMQELEIYRRKADISPDEIRRILPFIKFIRLAE